MQTARSLLSAVAQKGAAGVNSVQLAANNAGSATITVAIKAGSRHQASAGVAATMAASKSLTSVSHTNFLQMQQLEAAGANFTCENTRDHLVYTLECGPILASEMFSDVVGPAIFNSELWEHEIVDLEPAIRQQNAAADSLLDALHAVSFSSGLSASANVPASKLGSGSFHNNDHYESAAMPYVPKPQLVKTRITSEDLAAHRENLFNSGNVTVMTSGLDAAQHGSVTALCSQLSGNGPSVSAGDVGFVSGEHRVNTHDGGVSGYVGFPGCAVGDENSGAAIILCHLLGGVSLNYEGAGLIALNTSDPSGTVASLKNLDDVAIAQATLEAAVAHAHAATSPSGAASQAINGTLGANLSSVSASDVQALAAKMAKGPKSLSIQGDLNGVAMLSQL